MAQATVRVNAKNFALISFDTPNTHVNVSVPGPNTLITNYNDLGGDWMLFQFDDPTSRLGTHRLLDVRGVFGIGTCATTAWVKALLGNYNPNTVTYNTKPEISNIYTSLVGGETSTSRKDATFTTIGIATGKTEFAKELLKFCGGIFQPTGKSYMFQLYTNLTNSGTPYLEFVYDDTEVVNGKIVYKSGPTSGYRNPREEIAFAWEYERIGDYYCAADFTQTSAVFYWKESDAENYTEVNISGNQKGVTIPANTFQAGTTIQWYVQGTEAGGETSQTDTYSFSTTAGAVTSTPIAPINTIEANNSEITFEWKFSSNDGLPPSRYELWWKLPSEPNNQWHVLSDSTNIVTSYTAPANTFPASEIQWLIHAYNIDGTKGPDSISSFVSYGAPEAPAVYADEVPFATITWQATDQEGYEIQVDGETYGPYFGREKSFSIPEYLRDGQHSIKVRIVGIYGLWSQYGTTTVTIANSQGEPITLEGTGDLDAILIWETEENTKDFFVYRDGVQIAHTGAESFEDRFAVGAHVYYVVNRLPDGNYSISNDVALTPEAAGNYIMPLPVGEWMEIRYSEKNRRDPAYDQSAESFYGHLSGDTYPTVILSGFQEAKMTFSALFLAEQEMERRRFEAMMGKPVAFKMRDGTVFCGVLDSWNKEVRKNHWTEYSFTLRRIEWEEYIDDTQ